MSPVGPRGMADIVATGVADIVATGVADIAATGVAGTQPKGFEVGPAHTAGWVVPQLAGKLDLEQVVAPSVARLGRGVLASVPGVRLECGVSASVPVVQGIHGVAVRPVVFVVVASVLLVLNESAAKGECMVVPGRVAWVAKECAVSPPAAADTQAHGLSTPEWTWLTVRFLKSVVGWETGLWHP